MCMLVVAWALGLEAMANPLRKILVTEKLFRSQKDQGRRLQTARVIRDLQLAPHFLFCTE